MSQFDLTSQSNLIPQPNGTSPLDPITQRLLYSSPQSCYQCPCCANQKTRSVPAILRDGSIKETRRSNVKVSRHAYGIGGAVGSSSIVQTTSNPLQQALTPPPKPKLPPAPRQPTRAALPIQPQPPKIRQQSSNGYTLAIVWMVAGILAAPLVLLLGFVFPLLWLLYFIGFPAVAYFLFGRAAQQAAELKDAPDPHLQYQQRYQHYQAALARYEQTYPQRSAQVEAQYTADMAQWEQQMQAWRTRCESIESRWEGAFFLWSLLFYCSRCDQVFVPGTDEHAPLTLLHQIIWKPR